MERFNLRKLSDLEVRKQYQIKISIRLAVLENLNKSEEINKLQKTLQRVSKPQLKSIGLYELKQHKPHFDEECSQFLRSKEPS